MRAPRRCGINGGTAAKGVGFEVPVARVTGVFNGMNGSAVIRGRSLRRAEEVLRALTQSAIQLSISVPSQATARRPMRTGAGKLASRTRRQTDARDRPVEPAHR